MNNTGTKKGSIMKQTAFWRGKNGECAACLKYSVRIFVEQIYKMQRLEVSGAVRPIQGSLGVKELKVTDIVGGRVTPFWKVYVLIPRLPGLFSFFVLYLRNGLREKWRALAGSRMHWLQRHRKYLHWFMGQYMNVQHKSCIDIPSALST
jgi:hypothetical protein